MNLLAIDIGNTTISFGLLKGKKVLTRFSVLTEKNSCRLSIFLQKAFSKNESGMTSIDQVVICSVVPSINDFVRKEIRKKIEDSKAKMAIKIIGEDVMVPIKNHYKDPQAVGQDRLVGAFAAKELFGTPAIVIDLGTAITFDVVSSKGAYEGGLIVPGIRLSAESLFQRTALLPQIKEFKNPSHLIGKTTEESMLSGIFNGYAEMCNGLVARLSKQVKGKPYVIITGGYAALMRKHFRFKCSYDGDLIFKGLALLSQ